MKKLKLLAILVLSIAFVIPSQVKADTQFVIGSASSDLGWNVTMGYVDVYYDKSDGKLYNYSQHDLIITAIDASVSYKLASKGSVFIPHTSIKDLATRLNHYRHFDWSMSGGGKQHAGSSNSSLFGASFGIDPTILPDDSEETAPPTGGGNNGGSTGGNHTVIDRNVNVTIDTNGLSTGTTNGKSANSQDNIGTGLGEVVDYNTEKGFKMYFTNIPNSKSLSSNSSPIIGLAISMNDTFLDLPIKPNSKGQYGNTLDKAQKDYDTLVNSITMHLYDLNKLDRVPESLLSLTDSNQGKIMELTPSSKESLSKDGWLKIPSSGNYAVVVEVDSKSDKPTVQRIATTFKLDKVGEFKALPIKNRLNAFTENKNLMEGKLNNYHNLNLKFDSLNSLKVPSIFDSKTNQYLVGSLNGGLKLFDSYMQQLQLDQQIVADTLNVSQIVETSESKFLVSTLNSGVYLVDTTDKTISKLDGAQDVKNNAMITGELIFITTDEDLKVYKFQNKTGELTLRKTLTAREIFGSDTKLGEINLIGNKLIVNSLYNQDNNKVVVVSM